MSCVRRLLLLLPLLVAPAAAKETPAMPSRAQLHRRHAIAQGIAYLARQQNKDGSWGGESGTVGISALSLLAFLGAGHQMGRGPYGDKIRVGVDFLLRNSLPPGPRNKKISSFGKPSGYIYVHTDRDSRMHGHAYATQALALVYGSGHTSSRAGELRTKLRRAVRVIQESQTVTGGWGYEPNNSTFHEGSITVAVVQALRVARDAGFAIDKDIVDRGLKYLHASQKRDGSFKYALMKDRSTPALTAAAITAMHGFGEYYGKPIQAGLAYIEDAYRRDSQSILWPFYANYYTAQAFYRAGGRHWRMWQREIVPRILRTQRRGHWDDAEVAHARAHGAAYATAFACLALSVQDGYLPLFQK